MYDLCAVSRTCFDAEPLVNLTSHLHKLTYLRLISIHLKKSLLIKSNFHAASSMCTTKTVSKNRDDLGTTHEYKQLKIYGWRRFTYQPHNWHPYPCFTYLFNVIGKNATYVLCEWKWMRKSILFYLQIQQKCHKWKLWRLCVVIKV